jgi:molybdenum cofactor cytidylyltransferase
MKGCAILLAAGSSSRMGSGIIKQLLPCKGRLLINHQIKTCLQASCVSDVIVVLGAYEKEIKSKVTPRENLHLHKCEDHDLGMGASIVSGLSALKEFQLIPDFVFITLCDQPWITKENLDQLAREASKTNQSIVVPNYETGSFGPPVIVKRESFHILENMPKDKGAKHVLESQPKEMLLRVNLDDFNPGDIDFIEDIEKLEDL